MKKLIIFLDFDGVVNTIYYREYPRLNKTLFNYAHAADGFVNNRQAIEWLNELYKRYDYEIVVTSTWRYSCDYKQILYNSGLDSSIEILGATPKLNDCKRGDEIAQWIIDNHMEDRDVIILDDDDDMGIMSNSLIKCDGLLGFTIYEYMECLQRFQDLGYARKID